MKHRKLKTRLAALSASAVMIFAAGCGSSGDDSSGTTSETSAASTAAPVKVTLPPKETTTASSDEPLLGEDIPYTPAMWKATSPDGAEMYMMGSMHALNDTCFPLPDYVQSAYDGCEVLAVECDLVDITGSAAQLKYAGKFNYPSGETIKEHISAETWEALSGYFRHYGLDPADYETYTTWGLYSSIQRMAMADTGLASDKGLDRYLLKKAHAEGKEVYEVESMDEQLSMLSNFSDAIYDILLSDYSEANAEQLSESNKQLFKAWKTGDTEWLQKNSGTDLSALPEDIRGEMEVFIKAMYTDRNTHMSNDAKELIGSGKQTFFVVGLAHFLGDDGIVAQLEQAGITVERIH